MLEPPPASGTPQQCTVHRYSDRMQGQAQVQCAVPVYDAVRGFGTRARLSDAVFGSRKNSAINAHFPMPVAPNHGTVLDQRSVSPDSKPSTKSDSTRVSVSVAVLLASETSGVSDVMETVF